jgi:hypothetical protein
MCSGTERGCSFCFRLLYLFKKNRLVVSSCPRVPPLIMFEPIDGILEARYKHHVTKGNRKSVLSHKGNRTSSLFYSSSSRKVFRAWSAFYDMGHTH